MGQPSIFPHGVTIYDPEKCWSGYTIVPLINDGVLLFDMNGNEIRRRVEIRSDFPDNMPGFFVKDCQNVGFAAVKDDVIRLKAFVPLVIPLVRPQITHAVDMLVIPDPAVGGAQIRITGQDV